MQRLSLKVCRFLYLHIGKPVFFLFDAEAVHTSTTLFGQTLGAFFPVRSLMKKFTVSGDFSLSQEIAGIRFENPIGLAAGFDYERIRFSV